MMYFIFGYVLLGLAGITLSAYDEYTKTYDWALTGGINWYWWVPIIFWFIYIIGAPYYFTKELVDKIQSYKYAKEFHEKGGINRKFH